MDVLRECMSVSNIYVWHPQRSQEVIKSSGTGTTDNYEHCMQGTKNQIWILYTAS